MTGAERGIIAAASYEAKALGIRRGLQLHEAKRLCPDLVILPSDYEAYSLYSQRMFAILRRFTPLVEEYSIDEAFADLSGCGDVLVCPPETVAERLRNAVSSEMGLTVSVGISLTKTLAKLCSKFRKPNGQTVLRREHVPLMSGYFLQVRYGYFVRPAVSFLPCTAVPFPPFLYVPPAPRPRPPRSLTATPWASGAKRAGRSAFLWARPLLGVWSALSLC